MELSDGGSLPNLVRNCRWTIVTGRHSWNVSTQNAFSLPSSAILVNCAPSGETHNYCTPHIIKENSENFLIHRCNYILLSQVYCVWQVVKSPTIISNNPVYQDCVSGQPEVPPAVSYWNKVSQTGFVSWVQFFLTADSLYWYYTHEICPLFFSRCFYRAFLPSYCLQGGPTLCAWLYRHVSVAATTIVREDNTTHQNNCSYRVSILSRT